jgi:hypothetical protein
MLVDYNVSDKLSLHFEAANQKEIFKSLSQLSEVFSISECGACKSKDIRHVVREVPSGKQIFTYFELHCQKCRARLAFGQSTDTVTLFPRRKDDDGKYLDNGGWVKYVKPTDEAK